MFKKLKKTSIVFILSSLAAAVATVVSTSASSTSGGLVTISANDSAKIRNSAQVQTYLSSSCYLNASKIHNSAQVQTTLSSCLSTVSEQETQTSMLGARYHFMIYKSCVIMDFYPRKKLKYTKITNFIIVTAVSNVYTAMLVTFK